MCVNAYLSIRKIGGKGIMTKFQYFASAIFLSAAFIMLYLCIDLKPKVNYIMHHSEHAVTFNRSIYVALKYNANNETVVGQYHSIKVNEKLSMHSESGVNTKTRGMILVTLYAEQQVGAAMNMFSLQKWAKAVNASVVEPFVLNSMFKLPIVSSQQTLNNQLRFRDYFDIDIWNAKSALIGGMPLISWDTFINQAPKKYIFVAIVNSLRKEERSIFIDDEIMKQEYCNDTFLHLTSKYRFYIDQLFQAKLVRRVCLSFYKTTMHIKDFTSTIYGNASSSDVIVWFQVWKGFGSDRIKVLPQHFYRTRKTLTMLHSSKRILDASQNYISTILKSQPGKYTAISIRTVMRARFIPENDQSTFFHNCFRKLGSIISSTKIINNSTIFLALDLGRFGDRVAKNYMHKDVINNIETEVFQTVYNNSLTMQKWEQTFVQATNGIKDKGYIAAVQRTIVENSQCLILLGGKSNFQQTLLLTYKEKHKETCIHEVCYET